MIRKTVISCVFLVSTALPSFGADAKEIPGQWVNTFWFNPLPLQGVVPEGFTDIEASLLPDDCGSCHQAQFEKWKDSRHAHAMGDGITAQFHEPWMDKEGEITCRNCHSPLYEQYPFVKKGDDVVKNLHYDEVLAPQGVACAACHVRRQVRYGPPPRGLKDLDAPHGGYEIKDDFNRAEFCKPCHQFGEKDRKLNGKLLQNTYEEWKNSTYAEVEMSCAACHMPDREHSFKGIHSKDMAAEALDIITETDGLSVKLTITNIGAGHNFPTYITPKVEITGKVVTLEGDPVDITLETYTIQWKTSLDLKKEFFDTRLAPGASTEAYFKFPGDYEELAYEVEVKVFPDDFYTRFYAEVLKQKPKGIDLKKIESAYQRTLESPFSIYKRRFPL